MFHSNNVQTPPASIPARAALAWDEYYSTPVANVHMLEESKNIRRRKKKRKKNTSHITEEPRAPRKPFNHQDSRVSSTARSSISQKDVNSTNVDVDVECTTYHRKIYSHLRKLERRSRPSACYMTEVQREVNQRHRSILVDWLVDVVDIKDGIGLTSDTLFLGVHLIDKVLSTYVCTLSNLQAVGITCLLLAAKYEEISRPCASEFSDVGLFSSEEVLKMETELLHILGFNIGTPTTITFAQKFLRVAESTANDKMDALVNFLCTLTLLNYSCLKFNPSQIAASAVLLANYTLGKPPWTPALMHFTGYQPSHLRECVEAVYVTHVNYLEVETAKKYAACKSSYNRPSTHFIALHPAKAFDPHQMFPLHLTAVIKDPDGGFALAGLSPLPPRKSKDKGTPVTSPVKSKDKGTPVTSPIKSKDKGTPVTSPVKSKAKGTPVTSPVKSKAKEGQIITPPMPSAEGTLGLPSLKSNDEGIVSIAIPDTVKRLKTTRTPSPELPTEASLKSPQPKSKTESKLTVYWCLRRVLLFLFAGKLVFQCLHPDNPVEQPFFRKQD